MPIPVYAEMSSINPVVVLPGALAANDTAAFAQAYVGSLTLGSGQFCTNPGLLFLPSGAEGDAFLRAAGEAVAGASGQTMLTPGIAEAYRTGTATLRDVAGVRVVAVGQVALDERGVDVLRHAAVALLLHRQPGAVRRQLGQVAIVAGCPRLALETHDERLLHAELLT